MDSIIKGVFVFVLVVALSQTLTYQRYKILRQEEFEKATREATTIKDRLQNSLSFSLSATKTLAFIVERYGVPDDFDSIAKNILEENKFIDAMELTRKGVITHVYPLQGNESVLGFDVLADSLTGREAEKAIEKGRLYFAGPFDLKQGGRGVVGRLPLHFQNEFWGFSVVLIRMSTLLKAAGIDSANTSGFHFQLSKINSLSNREEYFLPTFIPDNKGQVVSIEVPDGEWKLHVKPKDSLATFRNVIPLSVLGMILSVTSGIFAWHLSRQPDRLGRLVAVKTAQVSKLNRLYHFTSRINHLMAHLTDQQTVFDEACKIAVDIGEFKMAWVGLIDDTDHVRVSSFSGHEAGYLQKITPLDLNTANVEGPILRLLRTNAYVHCNDISTDPLMKRWADEAINRGYRSSILLPMRKFGKVIGSFNLYSEEANAFDQNEIDLLQELTDDISFTIENIEREKMLKQAVQQAQREKLLMDSMINSLPGIFYLYDRQGKFVRWNKNFEIVSGYSSDEIATMQPTTFFHDADQRLLADRIKTVFDEGYGDVMADFFTKSKKRIPYFFNGRKINLDGTDYLIGMGIDITERVEAEKQLRERADEISKLTEYLQNVREEERTHIAREIHDVLGQQLTGLKIDSSWLRKRVENDQPSTERINEMISLIDDTIKTVRRLSSQLRPGILDDLGLVAALEWQSSEFEKRTGIKTIFNSNASEVPLDEKISTNMFRVFQESLTNVARHAQASLVEADLDVQKDFIVLQIKDNGIGFQPADLKNTKSLGLIGMRERARIIEGELSITPGDGKGTVVTLKVSQKS